MTVISALTAPARLALRVVDLGRDVLGRVVPHAPADEVRPPTSVAVPMPAAPAAPVAARPGDLEPDRTEQPEFQPAHLDEEPAAVVYSSADEGAVDAVGATLHVGEPWNGYAGMTVPDVVDRLVVVDTATLATVRLYEETHRARKSVLAAVEQQLART